MLRYPGGKLRLQKRYINPEIQKRFGASFLGWTEAEPFVGGGGSLINMAKDFPHWKFHINDKNSDVYGFWKTVLTKDQKEFDEFVTLLDKTKKISVDYFYEIFDKEVKNTFDAAWKVLVLNKCSYSGILTGRQPIGGSQQKSKWKVDVYWNPPHLNKLLHQTRTLLLNRVQSINCLDYKEFLINMKQKNEIDFVYADPPYLPYGHNLYGKNFGFVAEDLKDLMKHITPFPNWCVSINDSEEVRDIVKEGDCVTFDALYAGDARYREAERKKEGVDEEMVQTKFKKKELMVFSKEEL